MPFGHPYRALGEAGSDRLRGEVPAALSLLGLKISKPSDRFAGDVDPDILGCAVGVTDQSCDASGVEDAIKITTGGLGGISELVTGGAQLITARALTADGTSRIQRWSSGLGRRR